MPFYEFECLEHGRFTVRQPMFDKHSADCPSCSKPAERRFSCNFRFAVPLTIYQDLGGVGDRHRGYQEIGHNPDSGITPPPGQPYKTAKQVQHEEEDSKNKEARLCRSQ